MCIILVINYYCLEAKNEQKEAQKNAKKAQDQATHARVPGNIPLLYKEIVIKFLDQGEEKYELTSTVVFVKPENKKCPQLQEMGDLAILYKPDDVQAVLFGRTARDVIGTEHWDSKTSASKQHLQNHPDVPGNTVHFKCLQQWMEKWEKLEWIASPETRMNPESRVKSPVGIDAEGSEIITCMPTLSTSRPYEIRIAEDAVAWSGLGNFVYQEEGQQLLTIVDITFARTLDIQFPFTDNVKKWFAMNKAFEKKLDRAYKQIHLTKGSLAWIPPGHTAMS